MKYPYLIAAIGCLACVGAYAGQLTASTKMLPSDIANLKLVQHMLKGFERDETMEEITVDFADDAIFTPIGDQPVVGRAAIAARFAKYLRPGDKWTITFPGAVFSSHGVVSQYREDRVVHADGSKGGVNVVDVFYLRDGKIQSFTYYSFPLEKR